MKNIHVIPTDKPSRLLWCFEDKKYYTSIDEFYFKNQNELQNQNIYITNDEEIKEGDWLFEIIFDKIFQCESERHAFDLNNQNGITKIILTTDQDLNGVQAIDDEFLEWFVKNPSCEEVEIIKTAPIRPFGSLYKIIIPQEEPKQTNCPDCIKLEGQELSPDCCHNHKQETLKKVYLNNGMWFYFSCKLRK